MTAWQYPSVAILPQTLQVLLISIIDTQVLRHSRVVRTLLVGDEPRDIVFGGPAGMPAPSTNFEGEPAPENSLIVKFNAGHWVDTLGRAWDDQVKFSLPDQDVFAIDANTTPPALVSDSSGFFSGVGTILYNMAFNPVSGKIYVSNTDANNLDRFEGPGIFAGHSLRGHLHESRITVLTPGSGIAVRHLNTHIDYGTCCASIPNAENAKSLALPQSMVVTSNGQELYV